MVSLHTAREKGEKGPTVSASAKRVSCAVVGSDRAQVVRGGIKRGRDLRFLQAPENDGVSEAVRDRLIHHPRHFGENPAQSDGGEGSHSGSGHVSWFL